jgi:integrase|tara:strand:+ start:141 stop:1250 length:1110 start_codon:yes stop_codon:yes gene_type:complete
VINLARYTTKYTGVIYRDSITNEKPDKTYYIRYKDINNKTKELKIGKYSEGVRENYCNQKRNEIITKLRLGEEPPAMANKKQKNSIAFKYLQEKYFETRKETKSKYSDIVTANKHLVPFFEKKNLETLTKDDVKALTKLLKTKTTPKGTQLSPKSRNNILTSFASIINYGLKEELIKNDVTKYIEKERIDNERERYLELEEINKLYKEVKHNPRLYLFCKLALTTGGRLGTILNISKMDIDFSNQIITLKDFKNNSTYKTFLTDDVTNLLSDYCKNLNQQDKIFIEPTTIQRQILKVLHNLFNVGIDKEDRKNLVVLHTLRHTFASHLAIKGTPIFTIQKLMNHRDIKMTLRYAKLAPDSGREAVRDLY